MASMLNLVMVLVLLTGFAAAVIALYGRYYTLPSVFTGPNICRLEAGGCQVLFRTPNAALLGIPNSALGVLYYPLLAWGLLWKSHLGGWIFGILFAASSFALIMSLVLAWILLRDKLECRVCWTGHLCNLLIWILLLARGG